MTEAVATEKANGRAKAVRKNRTARIRLCSSRAMTSAMAMLGKTVSTVKAKVTQSTCRKSGSLNSLV
jgi:hypothetical protein